MKKAENPVATLKDAKKLKLDARTKLIMIVLISTISVLSRDIIFLGGAFLIALVVDICLKVDLLVAVKRMRHLLSLIIFIAIVQSLFMRTGQKLVYIGNVTFVTTGGLLAGGEFVLRMSIIILAGLIATTSENREMVDGMIKMKLPYEFAFMVSVALRFIPLFREEFTNRLNAIAMRGIDIKKIGIGKRIKVYTYMLSPTVTSTVIRSRELAVAMESKAFRAYKKRSMLRVMTMHWYDWALIVFFILLSAAFLYFNYTIGGTVIKLI